MRSLGYLLITVGFLGGAYSSVQDKEAIWLGPFFVALALGVAGVVLVRLAIRRAAGDEGQLSSNLETLGASLERLVTRAEKLDAGKATIDVYELRHVIDREIAPDLRLFADAREAIAFRHGLQSYATIMSHFASGERHFNRVWSASTDGYIDEAHDYIVKAAEQMRETRQAFAALGAG